MEERLRFVARLLDGEGMSEVCRIKVEGEHLAAAPLAEAIEAYKRALGLMPLEAAIKDAA